MPDRRLGADCVRSSRSTLLGYVESEQALPALEEHHILTAETVLEAISLPQAGPVGAGRSGVAPASRRFRSP